jgi:two-component system response regulator NreC
MNDNQQMIRVIIVDDHSLFRIMMKMIFQSEYPDINVIAEADCGKALFSLPLLSTADLVLLDVNLPDISGVEIARRLRSDYPDLKILAISAENTAEIVNEMLEAGIQGFISKQHGDAVELAKAIYAVMSGLEYFGRDIASIIYEIYVSKKKMTGITPEFTGRELEIITLCRDGLICKEIAARLGIAERTVNSHKEKIFQKLGINNTMEMVKYALKNKIIKIEN